MTEINTEPGIPNKPVQAPTFNHTEGADTLVSDHPASTRTIWSKFRSRLNGKKAADALESDASADAPRTPSGESGPTRRKFAWYWVAGAAAVILVGGIVLGTTIPDPKKSSEFVALQTEKDSVSGELSSLQGRFDSLASGIKGREAAISAREVAVEKTVAGVKTADAAVKTAEAALKKREEAVTGAEKAKAANTIKEGAWTVGVDVEPGTYRANADVTSGCCWGIYRTGSNGSDIIDNDIVSGGGPSVTLSADQDFKTSRCGTWSKQ
ncbi:hypothetical protein [Arthrobacter sp. TB 26]|uniref:hypothetical protein n=1 Tax=Arthrobacter sp. TB 26 TaxID=494420 RepID=UPI000FE14705|nr:hypothetical protein [Arthrobacter sp. TB 26]